MPILASPETQLIGSKITDSLAEQYGFRKPSKYPDRYQYRDHVATGGMGRIDLVDDKTVGRTTAIKTISTTDTDASIEDRFLAEAKILGQLEHPNIVPLYDMGEDKSGKQFFTMRYIRGKTLEEIIGLMAENCKKTMRANSWAHRAQMLQQICDAIAYAHSRGIVHCDLKPANIMIGAFGELVIMDWGIASELETGEEDQDDTDRLTGIPVTVDDDLIVGTPAYLSPEVVTGKVMADAGRDIFAIGAIMYELLALEQPFAQKTVAETMQSVRDHQPPPLYNIRKDGQRTVPVELHYICMKALNKDPDKRYQSCMEMHDDLQLYLDGRFPVRCPSTALKSASQKLTHFIDDHPKKAVSAAALLGLAALSSITLPFI